MYYLIMKRFIKILFVLLLFIAWYYFNYVSFGTGRSMQPTLSKKNVSFGIPVFNPEAGDIVGFRCFSKCDSSGKGKDQFLQKRIININDDGCYWFEGDNKDVSYDSRNYGWLCPIVDFEFTEKIVAVWQKGKLIFVK